MLETVADPHDRAVLLELFTGGGRAGRRFVTLSMLGRLVLRAHMSGIGVTQLRASGR